MQITDQFWCLLFYKLSMCLRITCWTMRSSTCNAPLLLQHLTPNVNEILDATNLKIFGIKGVGLLAFQYNIPKILKPGFQK